MTNSVINTLFPVGQKVLVKDLELKKEYEMAYNEGSANVVVDPMLKFSNKVVTISEVFDVADSIKEVFPVIDEEELKNASNVSYAIEEDGLSQIMRIFTGLRLGFSDEMFVGGVFPLIEVTDELTVGDLYGHEHEGEITPVKLISINEVDEEAVKFLTEVVGTDERIEFSYDKFNKFDHTKWYAIITVEDLLLLDEIFEDCDEDCDCEFEFEEDFENAVCNLGSIAQNEDEIEVIEEKSLFHADFLIEKIIYNNPVTVVFYRNARQTGDFQCEAEDKLRKVTARCMDNDVYDKEVGLSICFNKMMKRESERNLKDLYKGKKIVSVNSH